ncbi:MAG: hypothetical protein EBZ95_09895 [Chitinophagia bacterium]|nr:hypothetical protein [Chitinophagia bacterium]
MKIEHYVVQFLYTSKKVTLQGIGTFTLDPSVILPTENEKEKDIVLPENAFQFSFNLKATEDTQLVNYIVQHTGKMFPLASSDLDSYITLAKQFLNIGKPLVIEGVGTIQKTQQGDYQFIPGHFITPKIDDIPKQLREKRDESISFETPLKENYSKRNLKFALAAVLLLLIGFAVFFLMNENVSDSQSVSSEKNAPSDSLRLKSMDSAKVANINSNGKDSFSFKIILKKYPSAGEMKAVYNRLTSYGHKLIIIKLDSSNYELAIPFKTPLSDTLRAKDSLKEFFGGSPYVKF